MSGPSTPKHSKDKRERKRAAGLVELRMYVPATELARLKRIIRYETRCSLEDAQSIKCSE